MKIIKVEVAECRLPLERPLYLGSVRVETRDYACLRILTDAGLEGFALGYRSGSQVLQSLKALAPRLLGRDPIMRQKVYHDLEKSFVPARASYVRALSLVDIALWDLTAKSAQLPLYRLLGGSRSEVQAIPVLGFSYHHRPIGDIQAEIEGHAGNGEALVKLMISGEDAVGNGNYLAALSSELQSKVRIGVDTHWSWRTLPEALNTCRRLDDLGLAFIEDPFLPQQWRLVGELRSRLKTPIAVGEDVLDAYSFLDLATHVDILRVDATGSGGITAAMNAMAIAEATGRSVFPHVFPYLHVHLACTHNGVMGVEYIPEHTAADPVRMLLKDFPRIEKGKFQISDAPGAGCELSWNAVADHADEAAAFEDLC